MSQLHLAAEDDADRLLPMVAAFHAETGRDSDAEHRLAALAPPLAGNPLGAVWLIGPRRAPVGYVAVGFTWSIAAGGVEALIEEFYVRPAVRGRHLGDGALQGLCKALAGGGVTRIGLRLPADADRLQAFLARHRFAPRTGATEMTRAL